MRSEIAALAILSSLVAASYNINSVNAQDGNAINSKYLTITDHRYRDGSFSDQITGVVVNNATTEIRSIGIYAALYDETGQLITTESGFADVSPLPAGDNAAFSISLFGIEDDEVDHYTLLPGGTP